MNHQAPTVASFIAERINNSPKTQSQIAKEVGFNTPNIVSMVKSGTARLPINKVPSMARALETDPVDLLILCLKEYQPENWEAIEPLLDLSLTSDERRFIHTLRASVGGPFLAGLSDESKHHMEAFLDCLRREAHAAPIQ